MTLLYDYLSYMKKENLKIIFFGTPEFAVESLDALCNNGYNVAAVVTMPDKIAGRGHKLIESDVKKYAVVHGLPVLQPANLKSEEFLETLREINADLFIVIAFRMLPQSVWSMPRLGTFNLHASLLPKYRGAAPINRAIMEGDTETGVTTFFLQHEIDTGDIILQKKTDIDPEENLESVYNRLMHIGAEAVLETVAQVVDESIKLTPQPEGEYTPAPKIFKETCRIDWHTPSFRIHNQIRGLSPYPAAYTMCELDNNRKISIKIFQSKLIDDAAGSESLLPGSIVEDKRKLIVKTADGLLEILSLQPEGKKRMDTKEFLLGYHPLKME